MRLACHLSLILAAVLAVALTSVPAAPAESDPEPRVIPRWRSQVAAANRFVDTRQGKVGYAVLNHRGVAVGGEDMHTRFNSASVFKTMLMVCYLNDPSVRNRALTRSEKSRIAAMITRSADEPANWLYGRVSQNCLRLLARSSGMRGFSTQSIWGRTQITPYGTARMFFLIDKRIVPRHRAQAMRWLRGVVPSQRWGLARTVPRGMAISFKGGFVGPSNARVVSQGALFSAPNGHRIAVAVLTNDSPSQRYGEQTLEGVGRRLLAGYVPEPAVRR